MIDDFCKGGGLSIQKFPGGAGNQQVVTAEVSDEATLVGRQCSLVSQDLLEHIFHALDVLKLFPLHRVFRLFHILWKLWSAGDDPLANGLNFRSTQGGLPFRHPGVLVRVCNGTE